MSEDNCLFYERSIDNMYDNHGKLAATISSRLNGTVSVFGVLNDRFIQTPILLTLESIAKAGFECLGLSLNFGQIFYKANFIRDPAELCCA